MNQTLKWKLIAVFLLVFLAGGMAGAFIGASHAHQRFLHPQPGVLGERMRRHLRVHLRLTEEQVAKISPVVDKTAAQLGEIQRGTAEHVRDAIAEEHRQIAPYLSDEQRVRLKALEARPRRWPLFHGPRHAAAQRRELEPENPEPTATAFAPPTRR